jgi:hypothetical protein
MTAPLPRISYLSTWGANSAIDFLLLKAFLSAHTDDPTPAGLGSTEVLGGGYQRQPLIFNAAANRAGVSANPQVFTGMPECTVAFLGVYNALTGGRMISAVSVDPPIPVSVSGQLIVAAGDIALVF